MNYELVKELKDAGFPQEGKGGYETEYSDYGGVYFPTLAELIEACGDGFHCLVYTTTGGIDSNKKFYSAGETALVKDWQTGSTPEIAVARLWLALNTK